MLDIHVAGEPRVLCTRNQAQQLHHMEVGSATTLDKLQDHVIIDVHHATCVCA